MQNESKITMRVALYSRVSTQEQTENFSLAAQQDILRKHADDCGYVIADKYVDSGYSGARTDRPELQRLLRDAKERKFDLVLVYRLDRFFRSTKDLLATIDVLSNYGVNFKSCTEPFESQTSLGRFQLSLLGLVAELERNTFVERSKQGKLRRYKEGNYAGTPVFGYTYDPATGRLSVNEREAQVIRLIFQSYCESDSSLVKVARRLRQLGYKTKMGKEFVSHVVYEILRNSVYSGKWFANRLGKSNKLKPESEWILVQVPAIVPEEQFEMAQKLLDMRKNYSRRNVKKEYLLRGLVKCGECGSTIAGTYERQDKCIKNGKTYGPYFVRYYRCTRWSKNLFEQKVKCNLRYVRTELLDDAVWGKVEPILHNPHLVEKAIQCKERLGSDEAKKLEREAGQIDRGLERLAQEEDRVFQAFKAGVIGLDKLKIETAKVEEAKTASKSLLSELQTKLGVKNLKDLKGDAVRYIEKVKRGIHKFDFGTKQRALRLLNTQVKLFVDGNVDIFLNIPQVTDQPAMPFYNIDLAACASPRRR